MTVKESPCVSTNTAATIALVCQVSSTMEQIVSVRIHQRQHMFFIYCQLNFRTFSDNEKYTVKRFSFRFFISLSHQFDILIYFPDIDECNENTHNCHEMYGICTNKIPTFLCTCALGSKGNGTYCLG